MLLCVFPSSPLQRHPQCFGAKTSLVSLQTSLFFEHGCAEKSFAGFVCFRGPLFHFPPSFYLQTSCSTLWLCFVGPFWFFVQHFWFCALETSLFNAFGCALQTSFFVNVFWFLVRRFWLCFVHVLFGCALETSLFNTFGCALQTSLSML